MPLNDVGKLRRNHVYGMYCQVPVLTNWRMYVLPRVIYIYTYILQLMCIIPWYSSTSLGSYCMKDHTEQGVNKNAYIDTVCLQQKVLSNSMRSHKWHHKILWVTLFDIDVQYHSKITPHCSLFFKHIRSIWVNRITSHNFMCFRALCLMITTFKHRAWNWWKWSIFHKLPQVALWTEMLCTQ